MTGTKKLIIEDLKAILAGKLQDNLVDLVLFGSQLSEKSHQDSDYDILIILKQKPDWRFQKEISDLCYEIDLKYGITTDTHILSETELNSPRGKQPIFANALSKGYHA